eukprot:3912413-Alexandrium_andersonii.AAC.1
MTHMHTSHITNLEVSWTFPQNCRTISTHCEQQTWKLYEHVHTTSAKLPHIGMHPGQMAHMPPTLPLHAHPTTTAGRGTRNEQVGKAQARQS